MIVRRKPLSPKYIRGTVQYTYLVYHSSFVIRELWIIKFKKMAAEGFIFAGIRDPMPLE